MSEPETTQPETTEPETAEPETAEPETTTSRKERGHRKIRQGTVVSDGADKTVVVRVDRRRSHPLYGKVMTLSRKYHAHDENNEFRVGDTVRIQETRPLSKMKRWRVLELVERPEKA